VVKFSRVSLKTFYILALLLPGSTVHGADLITVYRQAVLTNPQLKAAAANLQAVREQRPQAIAGLLPTLFQGTRPLTTRPVQY